MGTKQRQVPMIQTVQKTVEVPQVQYIDKVVDVPVTKQRQVPMIQTVQKTVEVPQIEFVDNHIHIPVHKHRHVHVENVAQKFVDVPQIQFVDNHVHIPVQKHRHVPMIMKIQKPVEVPVLETVEKIVDVPVIKQVEVPQIQTVEKVVEIPQVGENLSGQTRHKTTSLQPIKQQAPAEVVQVVEQGPPMPAEKTTALVEVAQAPVMFQQPVVEVAPMTIQQPAVEIAAPVYTQIQQPNVVTVQQPAMSTFNMLDTNHDGVITRSEFMQAAPVITGTAAPLTAAPVYTTGSASIAPVTTGSASLAPANMIVQPYTTTVGGYDMTAQGLFNQMDTNHDGVISRSEMAGWRIS